MTAKQATALLKRHGVFGDMPGDPINQHQTAAMLNPDSPHLSWFVIHCPTTVYGEHQDAGPPGFPQPDTQLVYVFVCDGSNSARVADAYFRNGPNPHNGVLVTSTNDNLAIEIFGVKADRAKHIASQLGTIASGT